MGGELWPVPRGERCAGGEGAGDSRGGDPGTGWGGGPLGRFATPRPLGKQLAGNGQLRRKDCRPRGLDALMQAQRGSFAFFAPFNS